MIHDVMVIVVSFALIGIGVHHGQKDNRREEFERS